MASLVSGPVSGAKGLGLSPGRGHSVASVKQDPLLSQCLSPTRRINEYWRLYLGVTRRWTNISSRGRRKAPCLHRNRDKPWPDGSFGLYADLTYHLSHVRGLAW